MKDRVFKILIVDDHPMMRTGLIHLIAEEKDLSVCCEAEGMADAVDFLITQQIDLMIVDLMLTSGSGFDLIDYVVAHEINIPVLVLSMHDESLYAERVLEAGAMGYINKQEATDKVVIAIRQVLSGKAYLSEAMTERILKNQVNPGVKHPIHSSIERLSNRELTIFGLIGEGYTTSNIAKRLNLSVKTIESHQANIKKKLLLNSAHELSRRAMLWVIDNK